MNKTWVVLCALVIMNGLMLPASGAKNSTVDRTRSDYIDNLRDKVFEAWKTLNVGKRPYPAVDFHINPDGAITDAKIIKPSGDQTKDDAFLEQVKKLAPLMPPPQGIAEFNWDLEWPANMTRYVKDVQKRAKKKWKSPPTMQSESVDVVFKLNRNGTLASIPTVSGTTGSRSYDAAGIEAVKNAAPYPHFPAGAPGQVDIQLTFDRNVFSAPGQPMTRPEKRIISGAGEAGVAKLNNEGVTAMNQGDMEKAISLLLKACAIDAEYPYSRDNLAIAYNNKALKSMPKDALNLLRRALFLQPNNATAQQNLSQVMQARAMKVATVEDQLRIAEECKAHNDMIGATVHYELASKMKPDETTQKLAAESRLAGAKQLTAGVSVQD